MNDGSSGGGGVPAREEVGLVVLRRESHDMAVFRIALTEDEQRVVNAERDSHPEAHVRRKMLVVWLSALWPDTGESGRDRRPEPPDRPAVRRGLPYRRTGRAAAVGCPGPGQRPRRSYQRHPRGTHPPTRADGGRSRRADRTPDGAQAGTDPDPEVPENGTGVPLATHPGDPVPAQDGLTRSHPGAEALPGEPVAAPTRRGRCRTATRVLRGRGPLRVRDVPVLPVVADAGLRQGPDPTLVSPRANWRAAISQNGQRSG